MIEYDSKGWLSIVLRVRGSVLPRLLPRILLTAGMGAVAAWVQQTMKLHLATIAHTLIGAALGLLLVFRTNASFDRFWEGRKLLGMITNRARDFSRQVGAYVDDPELRRELRRLLVVMTALINQMLRRERDLGALGDRLSAREREALEPAKPRSTVVALWITARLRELADAGRLSENRLAAMDQNLTSLIDSLGGAERIMKTPVPFAYAQHIKTFVLLFCLTVPFAMTDAMGWYTPVASALLAFALLGIDEIGVEIEDPFGYDDNDLPLDAIQATIEEDTAQIIAAAPQR